MKPENSKIWLGTSMLAAIAASMCCIAPILALVAGASGAASSFSWIEPARPYLIGLSAVTLGFAWYQKLKPQKVASCCVNEPKKKTSFLNSKGFLVSITVVSILLTAFPYYSHVFYPKNENQSVIVPEGNVQQATLKIEGMTCTGCEEHVNSALFSLPGVITASSSYEKGQAIVKFDHSKVSVQQLAAAIEKETGYIVKQ
jgi:mercuric ion transport protein